jgi:hypothetical protein
MFQQNLLPTFHRLWASVCTLGLGRIVMNVVMMMAMVMAMMMLAMAMVLVMVITVLEALRQVGWVHQHQHRSFHRLRAFY